MSTRIFFIFISTLMISCLGFAQAKKPTASGTQAASSKREYALGFFSGVHINQASTKTNGSTVNMKGSSFPIGIFFDGAINGKYSYQLTFANEPYMVEGNSDNALCGNSSTRNCDININYFGLGGSLIYNIFTNEKVKARAFSGITFLFPQTKTSNVLDIGSQGKNFNLKIGLALDLAVSEWYYVPVALGFNYFPNFYPNENDFSTSGTTLHIGFGVYLN